MPNTQMFVPCPICKGTKVHGLPPETCYHCGGEGKMLVGDLSIPNVFHAYEVLECLDATEHAALTDTQKDGVLHLLACGRVDLNDGKAGKERLWNWFGEESTTVANLTALIG